MNTNTVQIVDRGKGPQFSHCRITIQDLVQYFRTDTPRREILRWMPLLTESHVIMAEAYYREHKAELDELDRQIDKYREEQSALQRQRFPPPTGTKEERIAKMRARLKVRNKDQNGVPPAG